MGKKVGFAVDIMCFHSGISNYHILLSLFLGNKLPVPRFMRKQKNYISLFFRQRKPRMNRAFGYILYSYNASNINALRRNQCGKGYPVRGALI